MPTGREIEDLLDEACDALKKILANKHLKMALKNDMDGILLEKDFEILNKNLSEINSEWYDVDLCTDCRSYYEDISVTCPKCGHSFEVEV